eukprot:jgi/Mesen1/3055/ME000018S02368
MVGAVAFPIAHGILHGQSSAGKYTDQGRRRCPSNNCSLFSTLKTSSVTAAVFNTPSTMVSSLRFVQDVRKSTCAFSGNASLLSQKGGMFLQSPQNKYCRRLNGKSEDFIARSTMGDAEGNPLGAEGYWDTPEGKEQLKEIQEMRELKMEVGRLEKKVDEEVEEARRQGGAEGKSEEELAELRAERLREELAREAREQAERRREAQALFKYGQAAYGRGVYDKAVEIFEAALSNTLSKSELGGEIQIWLAMAYDANGRHADCIALYKRLELGHPSWAIKRQAADLRYITEAPKLKISRDEMVTVPILDRDNNSNLRTWSQMVREKKQKTRASRVKAGPKDPLDAWLVWKPPRWERSPYFWIAITLWLTALGVTLMFQD